MFITFPSAHFVLFFVSETQLDPECGWIHRRGLCGFAQDLWRLHEVGSVSVSVFNL